MKVPNHLGSEYLNTSRDKLFAHTRQVSREEKKREVKEGQQKAYPGAHSKQLKLKKLEFERKSINSGLQTIQGKYSLSVH